MSVAGQRQHERRASARRPLKGDRAAQQAGELLAEMEAKPGAVLPSAGRRDPGERVEKLFLILRPDADARVDDANLDGQSRTGIVDLEPNMPRVGELDRVVGEVDQ